MSTNKAGYEKSDVNIAKLSMVGIAIVLFIAVSLVLLNEYFLIEKEAVVYSEVLQPKSISLAELRAKEEKVLTSYQLVDSTKQVYSIPIDKAMELYLDENSNIK